MPDDLLIERAKKNNQSALNDVIIKCSPFVYNLCQKWCRPPIESEDVTQNALIKISKNLNNYRFESKFSTWVYSLTYNVFLDEYRKVKRRNSIAPQVELGLNDKSIFDTAPDHQSEQLELALSMMSDDHRTILLMIDVEQLSYIEAAEAIRIEVGTVRSRLARARVSFKENLGKHGTKQTINTVLSSDNNKDQK